MATVHPVPHFNSEVAEEHAKLLRKAIKGAGTNEEAVVESLTKFSNAQRQEIKKKYKALFDRDLDKDLKSELKREFQHVISAILDPPRAFLAKELKAAMKSGGTDEDALAEILLSRSNEEVHELKDTYKYDVQGRDLESDVRDDTSGDFQKILIAQLAGVRDTNTDPDDHKAQLEAKALQEAGIERAGTDEDVFNRVLCGRSFPQLRQTFAYYYGHTHTEIEESIKKETRKELQFAYLTIAKSAQSVPKYYAERLYRSMKGAGTRDRTLIRIIVSRSEIDLEIIKNVYKQMYKKSLESWIKGDTTGAYRKALLALVKD